MIQRIQTLYFAASGLIMGLLAFFVSFFQSETGRKTLVDYPIFLTLFILSAILSFVALFMFKKRQLQVVLGRLNIILLFIVIGFLFYFWYENFGTDPKALGIGIFLPIVSVVLISLANRGVMQDEMMIRAADRLR
jgi:drug/metabolite transporter (DMT)-like permease